MQCVFLNTRFSKEKISVYLCLEIFCYRYCALQNYYSIHCMMAFYLWKTSSNKSHENTQENILTRKCTGVKKERFKNKIHTFQNHSPITSDPLNTEILIGRKCTLVISHISQYTKKWPYKSSGQFLDDRLFLISRLALKQIWHISLAASWPFFTLDM